MPVFNRQKQNDQNHENSTPTDQNRTGKNSKATNRGDDTEQKLKLDKEVWRTPKKRSDDVPIS
ncbi:hypothetical protein SAMN02745124_01205 [Desulfofustis glycolicus DSM 9705]|uniref:Uncharacterized protein n=1 Tax=Desulfofustis glycolicus DSM 9705 TaxID=1121409 RepID=A0A1M5UJW3_9BACT|nr:hypothetical protein SAMN02745124_01205 [Desulfofustis glycolicus DSM 9705]